MLENHKGAQIGREDEDRLAELFQAVAGEQIENHKRRQFPIYGVAGGWFFELAMYPGHWSTQFWRLLIIDPRTGELSQEHTTELFRYDQAAPILKRLRGRHRIRKEETKCKTKPKSRTTARPERKKPEPEIRTRPSRRRPRVRPLPSSAPLSAEELESLEIGKNRLT